MVAKGPMSLQFHNLVFLGLLISSSSYAGLRGGMPERLCALSLTLATIATILASHASTKYLFLLQWRNFQYGVATIDVALFGANLLLAVYSTRYWTLVMAAMLGCEVIAHVARALFPDQIPTAYYAAVAVWSYPTLLLLFFGTRNHQRRLREYGIDYDWAWQVLEHYR